MGIKYSNKINKFRTIALLLVFGGIIIMYLGLFFQSTPILLAILMGIGFLSVISSTVIYFWIGMLSTRTMQVECPTCSKTTKLLGKVDACMHCDQPLTVDKSLEGKEFNKQFYRKK